MSPEESERICDEAAEKLGEHFDAAQIMVTWSEEGQTHCYRTGTGNWYARQGMAHEFISSDIAQDTARQIANEIREEDDE